MPRLFLLLLALGVTAAAAPPPHPTWVAHPTVAIVSAAVPEAAPRSASGYAEAFSAAGFPVRWVRPETAAQLLDTVLVVAGPEAARLPEARVRGLLAFVQRGGRLVTAGESPLSRALGIRFATREFPVIGVDDSLAPALEIAWKRPVVMRAFEPPEGAGIVAVARGTELPIVVGFERGRGAVMFLGTDLADEETRSFERFPMFLAAAEAILGVRPFVAAPRLGAFVDLAEHRGTDWDALARDWYASGIREIHLGAWDAFDRPAEAVRALIESCHRLGIRVEAWLALPDVSDAFWRDHPQWRERTATGREAVVAGRRLMALDVPECFEVVLRGLVEMLERFDWDGVDIANLHYESAAGPQSPDDFTPLNDHIREVFAGLSGFDPQSLFRRGSDRYWRGNPASLDLFLAFRRDLTVDMHEKLLSLIAAPALRGGGLDSVITLPDVVTSPALRDALAVDAERIAALARRFPCRLQVESTSSSSGEDPDGLPKAATAWRTLFPSPQPLGVDLDIGPRPGAAFPTSAPTGLELVELLAQAAGSFSFVTVRSDTTISERDRPWLAHALASSTRVTVDGVRQLTVETATAVEVELGEETRRVSLDGRLWPAVRGSVALVPRGRHRLAWRTGAPSPAQPRLLDINGNLLGAAERGGKLTVRYTSTGRAFITLSFRPRALRLDGASANLGVWRSPAGYVVAAPGGDHTLVVAR